MQELIEQNTPGESLAALEDLVVRARRYFEEADAPATRRAHRSDWKDWETWSALHGYGALPATPQSLVLYITHLAKSWKVSTIVRRRASISVAHQAADVETPTRALLVRRCMEGIRRELGTRPNKKKLLLLDTLRKLTSELPEIPSGVRDRALLLFGFATALRRSELSALNREDLEFDERGVWRYSGARKQTNPERAGRSGFPLPETWPSALCAPCRSGLALRASSRVPSFVPLIAMGRHRGELQARTVATIVKRHAERAGTRRGHRRRSFPALRLCDDVRGPGRHRTGHYGDHRPQVHRGLSGYVRHASVWTENAAAEIL